MPYIHEVIPTEDNERINNRVNESPIIKEFTNKLWELEDTLCGIMCTMNGLLQGPRDTELNPDHEVCQFITDFTWLLIVGDREDILKASKIMRELIGNKEPCLIPHLMNGRADDNIIFPKDKEEIILSNE